MRQVKWRTFIHMITDLPKRVFKRYHIDKHLSKFYLRDGGKDQLAYIWNKITSMSSYVYKFYLKRFTTFPVFISETLLVALEKTVVVFVITAEAAVSQIKRSK